MAPALDVYDDSFAENAKLGALGKTKSGKKLKIRSYPKFETLEEERLYRKQHLAAAFREFADRYERFAFSPPRLVRWLISLQGLYRRRSWTYIRPRSYIDGPLL